MKLISIPRNNVDQWHRIVPNALSPEQMDSIEDHMKDKELKKAGVFAHHGLGEEDEEIRKSKVSWIQHDDMPFIAERMLEVATAMNNQFFKFDLMGSMEDMQYTLYEGNKEKGGFYTEHMDYGRSTEYPRKLAVVVSLTDDTDYEGGEFFWREDYDPMIRKLSKGEAIVIPSFILHSVLPVTSGIRKTLIQWVHGQDFR